METVTGLYKTKYHNRKMVIIPDRTSLSVLSGPTIVAASQLFVQRVVPVLCIPGRTLPTGRCQRPVGISSASAGVIRTIRVNNFDSKYDP